jgi:hypothetical protein
MAELTRRCVSRPSSEAATAYGARPGWQRRLAFLGAAFLIIAFQGCVTETRSKSGLEPGARAVSVELRRTISGIGYNGVLFTPLDGEGADLLGWTPSEYDIARMEALVPENLVAASPRLFAAGLPKLVEYRRQYSGHLANDRRIIQANYIHYSLIKERKLDWKHSRVPVSDAGARYFQLWFDLDSERIVNLLPAT